MTSVTRDGSVEFNFFRKGVSRVRVVGDFAGQAGSPLGGDAALEMFGGEDGWWRATARLASGEYRFHYVADGESYPDYAAHGVEMDDTGVHSVLLVPERQQQQQRQSARQRPAKMVA
jgi:hypothetical protein